MGVGFEKPLDGKRKEFSGTCRAFSDWYSLTQKLCSSSKLLLASEARQTT